MINLSKRSASKELLDEPGIPFEDIRLNMKELNTINSLLGGHSITIDGIKKLLANIPGSQPVCICEIGCGGGDNLHAIETYCKNKNIPAVFIGIDIKKECIDFARQQYPSLPATWIVSDYLQAAFSNQKPDIIFSSLFCHHFTEPELVGMLNWMKTNSSSGFFINDLERNRFAYYSIKLLTRFFSKSYLVKNDAPVSVTRGFTKKEWQQLFQLAGINHYELNWKWAFRHLAVYKHE
ncbi:MAG: methyltransferase domain-containing protein [Ferruginibacter sp.]